MSDSLKPSHRKKKLGSYPYFTVMLSITLALFVIGLFALIFIHAQKLSQIAQENIEVNVILDKTIQENQRKSIEKILLAQPYILKINNAPQVKYVNAEEAKKIFIKNHGDDFTRVLQDNPIHAFFVLRIQHQYSDSSSLSTIAAQIEKLDGIKEVYYWEDLITKVNKNINIISIALGSFAVILLIASILLINNTIKLALYSQRFLIRSMQLVGATKGFIQKPFIIRASLQGLMSGAFAGGLLFGLLNFAYREIIYLADLNEFEASIIALSILPVAGAVIGLLSSLRAVTKYLNMSLDELY